jgi:fucose 4-O-acetylase-like acetyltransferase
LAGDITFFVIAVVLGQLTSYEIMTRDVLPKRIHYLALAGLIVIAAVYIILAYFPPHLPFFMDHNTMTYGISP